MGTNESDRAGTGAAAARGDHATPSLGHATEQTVVAPQLGGPGGVPGSEESGNCPACLAGLFHCHGCPDDPELHFHRIESVRFVESNKLIRFINVLGRGSAPFLPPRKSDVVQIERIESIPDPTPLPPIESAAHVLPDTPCPHGEKYAHLCFLCVREWERTVGLWPPKSKLP